MNSNGFQIEEDLDVIKVVVPYVEKDDLSDEENLDARDNVFEESEQQQEHLQCVQDDYEDGWD